MTYYLFENGDVSDANMVLGNFNELTYAILYNRMENDAQATAPQLNANIQSDLFCCAAGKYSTVCTACTTSTFSTNLYNNNTYNTSTPYCYTTTYYCTCVILTAANFECAYSNGCYYTNVSASASTTSSCCGSICICQCLSSGNLCVQNYKSVSFIHDFKQCSWGSNASCGWGSFITIINGTCCAGNTEWYGGGAANCVGWSRCFCLTRVSANCYSLAINGSVVCCINPSTFEITSCGVASGFAQARCSGNSAYSTTCFYYIVSRYSVGNLKIATNLKTYSTPKGSVVLSTVSTLPAGNCIRYNIKDQAGTVLLCDAIPDAVYSLSSPACCLYAEIYQCVECNLCTPQCMTQYALMYM